MSDLNLKRNNLLYHETMSFTLILFQFKNNWFSIKIHTKFIKVINNSLEVRKWQIILVAFVFLIALFDLIIFAINEKLMLDYPLKTKKLLVLKFGTSVLDFATKILNRIF